MPKPYTTAIGKTVQYISRLRGGGSALPGLVVEKIDPKFVSDVLTSLPLGVAVVSGTNGKTTTTKIVTELLEGQGLKVFTNKTGSNFVRGIAAALLAEVNLKGKLDADIAVLELDEAHAVLFTQNIQPNYALFLNVLRDQLDRFGEIDKTADLLRQVAEATTTSVVLNHDDPRLNNPSFTRNITAHISSFGVAAELINLFPSDDELYQDSNKPKSESTQLQPVSVLESLESNHAKIKINNSEHIVELSLTGLHNTINAVAAIALCQAILGDKIDQNQLFRSLSAVKPAFGRGETIVVAGQPCELVLVKNPSGFRLGLQSFSPDDYATMIAINDNYADGRDMSWLWDVDFKSLSKNGVSEVAGVRAYDMALRLHYDDIKIESIDDNIAKGLEQFLAKSAGKPKRIFCTYTAMLTIRKILSKQAKVERIL